MTSSRAIEYRITQQLIHRVSDGDHRPERLVRQVITVTAAAGGMLLLGSLFQEMLFAIIAGATIVGIALK